MSRIRGHFSQLKDGLFDLFKKREYWDLTVVCRDGKMELNRLLLGLSFPQLQDHAVALLPDFCMAEVEHLVRASIREVEKIRPWIVGKDFMPTNLATSVDSQAAESPPAGYPFRVCELNAALTREHGLPEPLIEFRMEDKEKKEEESILQNIIDLDFDELYESTDHSDAILQLQNEERDMLPTPLIIPKLYLTPQSRAKQHPRLQLMDQHQQELLDQQQQLLLDQKHQQQLQVLDQEQQQLLNQEQPQMLDQEQLQLLNPHEQLGGVKNADLVSLDLEILGFSKVGAGMEGRRRNLQVPAVVSQNMDTDPTSPGPSTQQPLVSFPAGRNTANCSNNHHEPTLSKMRLRRPEDGDSVSVELQVALTRACCVRLPRLKKFHPQMVVRNRDSRNMKKNFGWKKMRQRKQRCRACDACRVPDCRVCVFCRDAKRYGGPNLKRQACLERPECPYAWNH